MTVLLVDDQISILSGLISGLDWDNLGITSIKTADNASQAKEILEQEPVDIVLCDIEIHAAVRPAPAGARTFRGQ